MLRTARPISPLVLAIAFGVSTAAAAQDDTTTEPQDDEAGPAEASESEAVSELPVAPDSALVEEGAKSPAPAAHGLFGPLRIGPTISAAFPHLLNFSLDATYDGQFGISIGGGRFRTSVADVEAELRNWDIRARWFPWRGSFFAGLAYGQQGIVAKTTTDLETKMQDDVELKIPTTLRLEVETKYLTPHIGWFATWDSGFTLGFEIGYQLALSADSDLQVAFDDVSAKNEAAVKSSDEYKKTKDDVEAVGKTFGEQSVPYLNLLRIGWLF